jgi:glutamyl-tRNA synthetase
MRNYLMRLGWSHGNEEIIPTEQAIAWFDLANIGRSPARFDYKKLDNLNARYIRETGDATLAETLLAFIAREEPDRHVDERARARLVAAMPGLKERAKTLAELAGAAEFLLVDGAPPLDPQAEKLLSPEARSLLAETILLLQRSDWTPASLEAGVRSLAEQKGVKLGQVAQPLRAALTGKIASPPVFDMMAVLGREETLARLRSFSA